MSRKLPHTPASPAKCPTENDERKAVILWARQFAEMASDKRLKLLYADTSNTNRAACRWAGTVKGWPDFFLPFPPCDQVPFSCGLFIELKRQHGGRVSPEQKDVHDILRKNGYRVEVCRGAYEAIETISWYLGI